MTLTLQPATINHVDSLAELHSLSFPRGWSDKEFISFFEQDNVVSYLAYKDEQPVGFIFTWMVAGNCELLSVAVHPEHQRQGIGRQLVVKCMDSLKEKTVFKIYLEVGVTNQAARLLYESLGFESHDRRKNYYHYPDGSMEDALTMQFRFA